MKRVSNEEIEKRLYGTDKIIINIPKKTLMITVTYLAELKDGELGMHTESYIGDEIKENLLK